MFPTELTPTEEPTPYPYPTIFPTAPAPTTFPTEEFLLIDKDHNVQGK